jgi:deazaflavin-dependent oxidoreductase (nitroreductase family)
VRCYDDYLRWLYRDGRPNWFARSQNRLSAIAFAAGVLPRRVGTLEVRGRRSGEPVSFPVVIADYKGERYLVSMLGARSNWVRNVEASGGEAVLRHGRRELVALVEVEPDERAPILRRYLAVAPGARPHIPVARTAPLEDFAHVAPDYPVYRLEPRSEPTNGSPPRAA